MDESVPSLGRYPQFVAMSHLFQSDGGYSTFVENKYWDDIQPTWSPDGRQIYFSSDRCGHFEIWSLNVETRSLRQVTGAAEAGVQLYYPKVSQPSGELASIQINENQGRLVIFRTQ